MDVGCEILLEGCCCTLESKHVGDEAKFLELYEFFISLASEFVTADHDVLIHNIDGRMAVPVDDDTPWPGVRLEVLLDLRILLWCEVRRSYDKYWF